MLKCATSLWSADLANLASDIRRVEPYSERFHLDVAGRDWAMVRGSECLSVGLNSAAMDRC